MSQRLLGIVLVTLSALVFSTAGLFVKSVQSGSWDVIFWRGVHLFGDILALVMTFNMAVIMVLYRAFPKTPAAGSAMLSSAVLMLLAMAFTSPFAIDFSELPVLALFGLIFAVASITLAEGARRISAGQTALLSVLETPLAPFLAWLVLKEIPPLATLMGGSLVFIAVIYGQISTNLAR